MGHGRHAAATFAATAKEISNSGRSVTARGEEMVAKGEELHRLVDPRTGPRLSGNSMAEQPNGTYVLVHGVAMPVVNESDTTGSMMNYIDDIFRAMPGIQSCMIQSPSSPLSRYQAQVATGLIQDVYYSRRVKRQMLPYQISQFEGDNRIDEQMQLLVPAKQPNDTHTEDYQIAIYHLAFRVEATIWQYGLKGYAFITGDEIGHDYLSGSDAKEFLGVELAKQISAKEICQELLKKWNFFYLQVPGYRQRETTAWWTSLIGHERIIQLQDAADIPFVESVITGLTEGTIEPEGAVGYLTDFAASILGQASPEYTPDFMKNVKELSSSRISRIVESVMHIPFRAQADLPGFDKIPLAGDIFAAETDIWPVSSQTPQTVAPNTGGTDWTL